MYLLTVIPLERKARAESLTYFSKEAIAPGTLVIAPFRTGELAGMVTEIQDVQDEKSNLKNASFVARKIKKVVGKSFLSFAYMQSAQALAHYHATTLSTVLATFIPKSILGIAKKITATDEHISDTQLLTIPEILALAAPLTDRISFYKIAVRELFAQKKSLLIIAPTVQMVTLLQEQLSRGIEEYVIALSGELTTQKSEKEILRALRNDHSVVVICTPQFLALPRTDYGKIVIEQEGATSYRGVVTPFLDAKIFIELYAKFARAPLVLADSILSVETYAKIQDGIITALRNPEATTKEHIQEIIIPRTPETKNKRGFTMILPELESAIENMPENAHTFLFTLRNGIATQTVCKDCGEPVICEECGIPLVLYETKDGRVFICNACKKHAPSLATCTHCKSWNLFPIGIGIDGVYTEVAKRFPNRKIFRIDKSTITTVKQGKTIFAEYKKTPGAILIGTELALPYLKENPVTLVGIVSFDSLFHIPSYRVGERTVRLLSELREISEKYFYIQTAQAEHPILKTIERRGLQEWYTQELTERKQFNYPPFSTIIKIVVHGSRAELETSARELKEICAHYKPEVFAGWEHTKHSLDRVTALLRVSTLMWSQRSQEKDLTKVIATLSQKMQVLINPENLL